MSLLAVVFHGVAPAFAQSIVEPQELDPRFVALLKSRTCANAQAGASATQVRAVAARLAAYVPPHESTADVAGFIALDADQVQPEPGSPTGTAPLPIPSMTPVASASPATGDQTSASPTPGATFIPIPGLPGNGPQSL
ncbi:MAG: hypothetical protein IAI50_14435, partial [Candidatus Eremiobacteraeota bacterium]|nr:hypothetical protein [Candidatus Eremiobacteraeota bacterium]